YNYQWYGNTSNSNTGGSVISGETNSSFIPPTDTVGSFYYYVEITQPGAGCSVVSDVAEVNVNAAPNITSQPISEVYCFGETINPLSVSYANGVGTPAIQWYENTVDDNTTGTPISGENATSF